MEREMVKQFIEQLQEGFGVDVLVADSALYTEETLQAIDKLWWISRVPERLTQAQTLIGHHASKWRLTPTDPASHSLETDYAGIQQRWVILFSPDAHQRALHTLNKQWLKQSNSELKSFQKLCRQPFACEADARHALSQFENTLKCSILSETHIQARPRFKGRGRPAHDQQPDAVDYHIDGALASYWPERNRRLQRKSCFILASNQLDTKKLSDAELMAAYKDQQRVERGFRFLKDPMFMASTLYLKSPKRIDALMMVMTLSLLVYAVLEYRLRASLQTHDAEFPNQQGKRIQNPTARWVFQFFTGIQILHIQDTPQTQSIVLNMNEHQTTLLRCLGQPYVDLYTGN